MVLRDLRAGTGVSEHERVEVKSRSELQIWLKTHNGQTDSIWLVHYKKRSRYYLSYDEIVEEAICWGWIDSLPRALDDDRTMHRLSPRSPQSNWSARNKRIAQNAIDKKTMKPPGLKAISRAKENGRWGALDAIERGEIPADLVSMLASRKGALANFRAFPPSVTRGILEWIDGAKNPATRITRLRETADRAKLNERANQYAKRHKSS